MSMKRLPAPVAKTGMRICERTDSTSGFILSTTRRNHERNSACLIGMVPVTQPELETIRLKGMCPPMTSSNYSKKNQRPLGFLCRAWFRGHQAWRGLTACLTAQCWFYRMAQQQYIKSIDLVWRSVHTHTHIPKNRPRTTRNTSG